jgi:hypothetical protein
LDHRTKGKGVPKSHRDLLPDVHPDEVATLLIFRDRVVLSATVGRAIRHLGRVVGSTALAIADEVTCEAADLLSACGIRLVGRTGFWFDGRYKAIRQRTDKKA